MLKAVKGTYKNGLIQLAEVPDDISESPVIVTFLETEPVSSAKQGQMMTLGMFAGTLKSTEEDFKLAEFHGDPDDGLDWS
ncbi:MAG: hypothetical protein Q6M04_00855 [Thermostichus sp. BF3_bins_97]